LNISYLVGLGRVLGLKVNKDTFSEQNLKSRECIQKLKEMLAFRLMYKLQAENKDIFPTPAQGKGKKRQNKEEAMMLNNCEK